MENAGRGATDALLARFPDLTSAVLCCGQGNNGGDGFVVARRLLARGISVRVLSNAKSERLSEDARIMMQAYQALGGQLEALSAQTLADSCRGHEPGVLVVVDALFGTGLDREITGTLRETIEAINRLAAPVVSLDLPSGLDADTGAILGVAVRATLTVTFAHPKLGLLTPRGLEYAGALEVADIGVPSTLVEKVGHSALILDESELSRLLPARSLGGHKVESGRVAVLAGAAGTVGAARLVAHGALRTGAGLVTLLNFEAVIEQLEPQVVEVMTARLDSEAPAASLLRLCEPMHAVAAGPGLGAGERTLELVRALLEAPCVKVLDADALSALAHDARVLAAGKGRVILTPHPGEAGRLLGISAAEVESDRFGAVRRLADLTESVVILKGARTLIASPERTTCINTSGAPTLATGGAGDTLTGIIAALAVHSDPFSAACLGAGIHGMCGEAWQARTGSDRGMLASEIADEVPRVLAQLARTRAALPD